MPGTVSLTSKLADNLDERGKIGKSIGTTHRDDAQLDELIAEQTADAKSSKVIKNPLSDPSQKTKARRRS